MEVFGREEQVGAVVVDAAIEVHRTLGGPGLLETIYEEAFACELELRSLRVGRQVPVEVTYKGRRLGKRLRVDLLVEDLVVVECKATLLDHPVFEFQILTYLRLLDLKLGYAINFGQRVVKDGLRRVVNGL